MKFGLLFAQQLPPNCGISWQEPYRDMLECLPEAEELGYSSAFQVSHHVQPDGLCPAPLIAVAGAASVTKTMRVGTAVLLVPLYAPLRLAEDVAVLDCLSNGRFVLGVAPGYVSEEFAAHGVPRKERFGRMWEAIDLMERAWSGERFSFEGKYYRVPDGIVTPTPVQRPLPIWYGLSGPKSLARAAKRGGTLVVSPRHGIAEAKEHLAIWREAGGSTEELPVIREVFVAETKEKAELIAAPAVTYLFRELYGKKSAQGERELRDDQGNVVVAKEQVDFEHFKGRYIIGDPEFAYNEVEKYERELGATEIICWMHLPGIRGEDAMRSVRLFAKEVMPALASRSAASAQ